MPQIKGSAKWLDNVRKNQQQDNTAGQIDESEVKMENYTLDEELTNKWDELSKKQFHVTAENNFKIREVKEDFEKMEYMKRNRDYVHTAPGMLQRNAYMYGQHPDFTNGFTPRPRSESQVKRVFYARSRSNQGFSKLDDFIDSDEDEPPKGPKFQRPKTAFSKATLEKRHKANRPLIDYLRSKNSSCGDPGRSKSFQMLRRLTNVDILKSNDEDAKKLLGLQRRAARKQEGEMILQDKLEGFYKRIEEFKLSYDASSNTKQSLRRASTARKASLPIWK